MRSYRAFALAALGALAACAPEPPGPPAESPGAAALTGGPWFICDGIDAPTVFVASKRPGRSRALITAYDKATGLHTVRAEYDLGEALAGLGAVDTPLERAGAQAGYVREIDPAALASPGSAYTPPITEVAIGADKVACRWLPRTRFLGFSERRSWVVHEDLDGDLIYLSYDFLDPNRTEVVELSGGARTTRFSLEARGGSESLGPAGARFAFEHDGYAYAIDAPDEGPATVTVTRADAPVQTETLIAFQVAQGQ